MQTRSLKSRYQRLFRRRRKQVAALGASAEDQFERNVLYRFDRLQPVSRFVAGWLALLLLLIGCLVVQTRALGGYHKSLQPAAGGIYSEGIVDNYTNANPLYATGPANGAVSRLLFAGLFKYDERNRLVGDLAESWQVDATGKRYTVRLKPDLTWHDGKPLTSSDVVFTYRSIQNPDVQSPLNASWRDVTVTAPDERTAVFTLSNPLSSFPHSLTTGIIPQHALSKVAADNMRSVRFNTIEPVGAGPYKFKSIEVSGSSPATRQEEIALVPFEGYHAGPPKISSFIVRTYASEQNLLQAFRDQKVSAMVNPESVPDDVRTDTGMQVLTMPLTAANMVFFKTTQESLRDPAVRRALVAVTDVDKLTTGLPKPVLKVRSPLLNGSPGFDARFQQKYEGEAVAAKLLDDAGWAKRPDGIRAKDGKALTFKLYAQQNPEFEAVARGLREQWRTVGVDAQLVLQPAAELSATVAGMGGEGGHQYDALLYGISLGVDPDEYVYWHSKQADIRSSRLNFSEYKSAAADAALEAGRTRTDPSLRAVKLQPFLQAWQRDAPALGLYQPHFTYVTRGQVFGFSERTLTQGVDRFNTVESWMIRRVPQPIKE